MHKLTLLLFLSILLFPVTDVSAIGVIPPAETIVAEAPTTLKRKDLESKLGRQLTFRERVAFGWHKLSGKNRAAADQAENQGNGMAVAGFVCGVVGLIVAGVILGPLAVVFSAIGISKAKKEGRPLKGLAVAGLVLGIVATVGALIVIAAIT